MTIKKTLNPVNVALRTGPPTREELVVYYPHKFTWEQLKIFVNSGDLGLLKREKKLQERYDVWSVGIKEQYGSIINYLLNHRLQWGRPDTLSILSPSHNLAKNFENGPSRKGLPTLPADAPRYFTADVPPEYLSVIVNDWPYSVPPEIEHHLIWSRVPIIHSDIVPKSIWKRVEQDGLWGFTGLTEPPPSPSLLPSCIDALSEWGITLDTMVVSQRGTEDEEALIVNAGKEIDTFIKQRWPEKEWETAWFVNPPRLQSILDLSHIHIFAKKKID
ncbi:hypothetical protein AMATHDRAFT_4425 [Amanita thiersii Skay4041]|uniref:Uncharacterized protein n=1 Tax=Amanita thiersii Skay4041 TaxID=703135 RepID=A0A2A9NIP0_9AGAR|nr:hypothetical protein AMATHDRAFT_4425 [Amanita thiersii Skay4041]